MSEETNETVVPELTPEQLEALKASRLKKIKIAGIAAGTTVAAGLLFMLGRASASEDEEEFEGDDDEDTVVIDLEED